MYFRPVGTRSYTSLHFDIAITDNQASSNIGICWPCTPLRRTLQIELRIKVCQCTFLRIDFYFVFKYQMKVFAPHVLQRS